MFSSEVTVLDRARRRDDRRPADIQARYGTGLPDRALCRIIDVYKHGAKLEVYCDLPLSTIITLTLPNTGAVRARIIWSNGFEAGCRFYEPLKESDLEIIFQKGHA